LEASLIACMVTYDGQTSIALVRALLRVTKNVDEADPIERGEKQGPRQSHRHNSTDSFYHNTSLLAQF
jgi:hypothetical protein